MDLNSFGRIREANCQPPFSPVSLSNSGDGAVATLPRGPVGYDECPTHVDREALYEQFQPLVGSVLRRYGKTAELKQDLTGEIYYQFCRLVDSYDPLRGIPLCAYLARMLSQSIFNYVRDYWRKESRFVQLDERQVQQFAETPAEQPPCDESLIAEEFRKALPKAIAQLPHRQRLVLVWRYYDSRSFEEIAEQLHIKPASARSLLRHAVAALRVHFAREEEG